MNRHDVLTKTKKLIFLMVPVMLFFQSCNYVDVRSEYDTSANFRSFQTFQIQPLKNVDEYNVNEFAQQRILNAIISELQARGYRETSSNADLIIQSDIVTKDKHYTEIEHVGHGETRFSTYEYTEGTLVIDARNAKTNKLV